jgi:hypothetical protein
LTRTDTVSRVADGTGLAIAGLVNGRRSLPGRRKRFCAANLRVADRGVGSLVGMGGSRILRCLAEEKRMAIRCLNRKRWHGDRCGAGTSTAGMEASSRHYDLEQISNASVVFWSKSAGINFPLDMEEMVVSIRGHRIYSNV